MATNFLMHVLFLRGNGEVPIGHRRDCHRRHRPSRRLMKRSERPDRRTRAIRWKSPRLDDRPSDSVSVDITSGAFAPANLPQRKVAPETMWLSVRATLKEKKKKKKKKTKSELDQDKTNADAFRVGPRREARPPDSSLPGRIRRLDRPTSTLRHPRTTTVPTASRHIRGLGHVRRLPRHLRLVAWRQRPRPRGMVRTEPTTNQLAWTTPARSRSPASSTGTRTGTSCSSFPPNFIRQSILRSRASEGEAKAIRQAVDDPGGNCPAEQ